MSDAAADAPAGDQPAPTQTIQTNQTPGDPTTPSGSAAAQTSTTWASATGTNAGAVLAATDPTVGVAAEGKAADGTGQTPGSLQPQASAQPAVATTTGAVAPADPSGLLFDAPPVPGTGAVPAADPRGRRPASGRIDGAANASAAAASSAASTVQPSGATGDAARAAASVAPPSLALGETKRPLQQDGHGGQGGQGDAADADRGAGAAQGAGHGAAHGAALSAAAREALQPLLDLAARTGGAAGHTADAPTPTAAKADDGSERPTTPLVGRGLAALANQKGGSLAIRLDPPSLGDLRITMTVVNGRVSADLLTSNADAHALLSADLASLRQALEAQGLSVDRLSIQSAPPQSPHAALRHDAQSGAAAASAQTSGQQPQQQQGSGADGQDRSSHDRHQHHDAGHGQSRGRFAGQGESGERDGRQGSRRRASFARVFQANMTS